jgi:sodium-coupled neutral amino acid transporter 11
MFSQSSRKDRGTLSDSESREPLLSGSHEGLVQDQNVIFAIEDDEETNYVSPEASPQQERQEHNVRFQEEVQVIGPPLKSTVQSREAGEHPLAQFCKRSLIPAQNLN